MRIYRSISSENDEDDLPILYVAYRILFPAFSLTFITTGSFCVIYFSVVNISGVTAVLSFSQLVFLTLPFWIAGIIFYFFVKLAVLQTRRDVQAEKFYLTKKKRLITYHKDIWLQIVQFFYSEKTICAVFKPIRSDWLAEFATLYPNNKFRAYKRYGYYMRAYLLAILQRSILKHIFQYVRSFATYSKV